MSSSLILISSLLFLRLIVFPSFVSAYEVGFLGYSDDPDVDFRIGDVVWEAVPPNSNACHHITAEWADNLEFAFVRTRHNEEPVPQFMGLYSDSGRPQGQRGCLPANLKLIIKWRPELTNHLQMANTLNRDLTRWAVLVPHGDRTERIEDLLASLEENYVDGHVAWRPSGSWEIDPDHNSIFDLAGDPFEDLPLPRFNLIDSDNEDEFNYFPAANAGGEGDSDGDDDTPSVLRSSTEGSPRLDDPNAWAERIPWPRFILDNYPQLRQAVVPEEIIPVEANDAAGLGVLPSIGDIIDSAGPDSPEVDAETAALWALRDLSDPTVADWSQGNPLDELE